MSVLSPFSAEKQTTAVYRQDSGLRGLKECSGEIHGKMTDVFKVQFL